MYFTAGKTILFREEHSPRVLVKRVDYVSAPGWSPPGVERRGGPVALLTGNAGITDALAPWLLGARVFQSCVHLISTSPAAVTIRFAAFSVQMGIAAWWCARLLAAAV